MAETFVAAVQYKDLAGTVAIDGHDGSFLHDLAKHSSMPPGYWAVGFSLRRLVAPPNGEISFTLFAVRCDQAGSNMDQIIEYAGRSEEVPVYRFDGVVDAETFSSMAKRVDVKVLDRNLPVSKVRTYPSP